MQTKQPGLREDQAGFASIVIAIVLVLVLSLLTVGFAQLMQSEQRQSLDKQLSSQAYYAAESGVDDAVKAINAGYTGKKDTCDPLSSSATGLGTEYLKNNHLGSTTTNSTNASYPCLLINPTPPSLEYGSIGIGKSRVFEMEGRDKSSNTAVVINTIAISWEDPNDGTSFVPNSNTNCKDLYPVTGNPGWSYTGMLRAQIIPVDSFTLNRSSLANLSGTVFLCPNSANSGTSPGSVSYPDISGTEKNGPMVNGNCNVGAKPTQPRYCNAQITGLAMLQSKTYFLDLRSIYTPTRVTVRAYGTDGIDVTNQLNIAEAQTLVDSTGKAQDVLKRIQVRVPTHNSYAIPDGTSATDTICKQLTIQPGNGTAGCSP